MRDATIPVALLLACSRSPSPKLCAPLTSTRYGEGTSLHVDLRGARTIRRLGTLPKQPEGSHVKSQLLARSLGNLASNARAASSPST
jgi:hypothetical protein